MHHDVIVAFPLTDLVATVPLLVWIFMLGLRGGFWRVSSQTLAALALQPRHARVAVVIPARDEAEYVGDAIASLLRQSGVDLHIFLVDDQSSDGTAAEAAKAAQDAGNPSALTIITGSSLPSGWTGKLWAMKQGIDLALRSKPDFLLLTDADIAHGSGSIAELVALAERGPHDLVSLMVRLRCDTFAERLLIPAFVFFFLMLYPPRWISSPTARTAGAAGGCMLVRPSALAAIGGIERIHGEVIDDCALASAIKSSGGRVWLGLADTSASLRPCRTFAAIGNMIARSAFSQLRHSALLLAGTLAGLTLCFLLPVIFLFTREPLLIAFGASAWLLMAICYLPMVRFYHRNPLWAFTLPAAALFYMGATIVSAVRYWRGCGGQWKGRAQDVAAR
jgi:hopene-associated glycosyltransferase HpnB